MQQEINIHLLALTLTSLCDFHFQLSACCYPSLEASMMPSSSPQAGTGHAQILFPFFNVLFPMGEGCPPAVGLAKAPAPTAFQVGPPSEGSDQKLKREGRASHPGHGRISSEALAPTGSALVYPSIRCSLSSGSQNLNLFFASLASEYPGLQVSVFLCLSAIYLLTDSNV